MKRFFYTLKTAVASLNTHRGRSALTILGIVIAISAIILITSIGQGAQQLILGEISGLGGETLVIRPGKEPRGPTDLADTLFADSLTNRDLVALKKKSNVPGLVSIAPAVIISGSASHGGETFRPSIFGWTAEAMATMFDVYPTEGRTFGENEIKTRARVAVIGSKVKEELFGNATPIGETIKIKGVNFKVVGVFPPAGQVAFFNIDETVILPYSTAQKVILGINYYHEILVQAESAEAVDRTARDIELTLREAHGITDPEQDDFFVRTQQQAVEQIQSITSTLTTFLASVVAIALVVGGIGVMNIMLVSVTERTREIGLRKAVGATNTDILSQFLTEAVILTATGGVIGIALGTGLGFVVSLILSKTLSAGWLFAFPLGSALLGLGISAFVGLLFGIYPARQAAKKSPIEALQYE